MHEPSDPHKTRLRRHPGPAGTAHSPCRAFGPETPFRPPFGHRRTLADVRGIGRPGRRRLPLVRHARRTEPLRRIRFPHLPPRTPRHDFDQRQLHPLHGQRPRRPALGGNHQRSEPLRSPHREVHALLHRPRTAHGQHQRDQRHLRRPRRRRMAGNLRGSLPPGQGRGAGAPLRGGHPTHLQSGKRRKATLHRSRPRAGGPFARRNAAPRHPRRPQPCGQPRLSRFAGARPFQLRKHRDPRAAESRNGRTERAHDHRRRSAPAQQPHPQHRRTTRREARAGNLRRTAHLRPAEGKGDRKLQPDPAGGWRTFALRRGNGLRRSCRHPLGRDLCRRSQLRPRAERPVQLLRSPARRPPAGRPERHRGRTFGRRALDRVRCRGHTAIRRSQRGVRLLSLHDRPGRNVQGQQRQIAAAGRQNALCGTLHGPALHVRHRRLPLDGDVAQSRPFGDLLAGPHARHAAAGDLLGARTEIPRPRRHRGPRPDVGRRPHGQHQPDFGPLPFGRRALDRNPQPRPLPLPALRRTDPLHLRRREFHLGKPHHGDLRRQPQTHPDRHLGRGTECLRPRNRTVHDRHPQRRAARQHGLLGGRRPQRPPLGDHPHRHLGTGCLEPRTAHLRPFGRHPRTGVLAGIGIRHRRQHGLGRRRQRAGRASTPTTCTSTPTPRPWSSPP